MQIVCQIPLVQLIQYLSPDLRRQHDEGISVERMAVVPNVHPFGLQGLDEALVGAVLELNSVD